MARIQEQHFPRNGLQGFHPLSPGRAAAAAAVAAVLFAASALAIEGETRSQIVAVNRYGFDADLDADGQPDLWTRTVDRAHPHYVRCILDFENWKSGKGSVRMDAGGASAEYLSPWIDTESSAAYDVTGWVRTERLSVSSLRSSRARIEVRLYDRRRQPVATLRAFPEAAGTTEWLSVSLTDVTRQYPSAAAMRVALVLDGLALEGSAWFDEIEVRRRPISFITTNRPANLFYRSDEKILNYEARGLPPGAYTAAVSIKSDTGQDVHSVSLSAEVGEEGDVAISYPLPSLPAGPYVAEISLSGEAMGELSQRTRLGILPDYKNRSAAKNLGLIASALPEDIERMVTLTLMSGVGWIKLPLTQGDAQTKSVHLTAVAELRRADVTPAGVLEGDVENGAASVKGPVDGGGDTTSSWVRAFGETINTFAGRVQAWQLGGDGGATVISSDDDVEEFKRLKAFVDEVSFAAQVGMSLAAESAGGPVRDCGCNFVSMSAEDFCLLDASARMSLSACGIRFWVWLDLSGWDYGETGAAASRLAGEFSRLFAMGAETVFIKDAWQTRGVVDSDGNVAPFGLALCNVIHELANYRWEGSISFPGGTPNAVFSSDGDTTVLMWPSQKPSQERIFLGETVETTDMYGRMGESPVETGENVFTLSSAPVILHGADASIIKTRQTFNVTPSVIDSIYQMQPVTVSFVNRFSSAIIGEVTVRFPPMWEARPNRFIVRLKPGEEFSRHINLLVPYNALSGTQEVQIALDVGGAGAQKTTIFRRVELGSLAFRMDMETRSSGQELLVYQRVTNISEAAVNLTAFIEGEDLERVEQPPRDLAGGSNTTFIYRLPKAESWIGKRLRATARDRISDRFLNQEFTVSANGIGR